jgi:hypothetical protein
MVAAIEYQNQFLSVASQDNNNKKKRKFTFFGGRREGFVNDSA